MHIVFSMTALPDPSGKGYEVLAYQRIRFFLAQGHNVTLLVASPFRGVGRSLDGFLESIPDTSNLVVKIFRIGLFESCRNLLACFFDYKIPIQVQIFRSREFHIWQKNLDADVSVNVIIRSHLNRVECCQVVVLDAVDSMALNFERRVKSENRRLFKKVIRHEWKRLVPFERGLDDYDLVVTVAQDDLAYFDNTSKKAIPLGVDLGEAKTKLASVDELKFCFTGNFNYSPNLDAAIWLAEALWPVILRHYPSAELYFAGRHSDQLKVSGKNIRLVGRVESMAKFLAGMDVSFAPMRQGSGMQFKVLEAFAAGIPVCATPLGLGSIGATVDKHIFLFDDENDIVDAINRLVSSSPTPETLRAYVRDTHSWERISEEFFSIIENRRT